MKKFIDRPYFQQLTMLIIGCDCFAGCTLCVRNLRLNEKKKKSYRLSPRDRSSPKLTTRKKTHSKLR